MRLARFSFGNISATDRTIEIDEDTAAIVDRRSAEEGVSASEFIAALISREGDLLEDSAADIAELDRRWAAVEQGTPLVDHSDVCRWLETWGTANFKPWPDVR